MSRDLRTSQRINLEAPIKLMLDDGSEIECRSFNFSDKGLYVLLDSDQIASMDMGTILRVQFQGMNYTPPIATAEIVRKDSQGIGFKVHSVDQVAQ